MLVYSFLLLRNIMTDLGPSVSCPTRILHAHGVLHTHALSVPAPPSHACPYRIMVNSSSLPSHVLRTRSLNTPSSFVSILLIWRQEAHALTDQRCSLAYRILGRCWRCPAGSICIREAVSESSDRQFAAALQMPIRTGGKITRVSLRGNRARRETWLRA